MTVTTLPFKAVLLACDNGHYEATLPNIGLRQEDSQTFGLKMVCSRCKADLALVKTVTIRPGGRR